MNTTDPTKKNPNRLALTDSFWRTNEFVAAYELAHHICSDNKETCISACKKDELLVWIEDQAEKYQQTTSSKKEHIEQALYFLLDV